MRVYLNCSIPRYMHKKYKHSLLNALIVTRYFLTYVHSTFIPTGELFKGAFYSNFDFRQIFIFERKAWNSEAAFSLTNYDFIMTKSLAFDWFNWTYGIYIYQLCLHFGQLRIRSNAYPLARHFRPVWKTTTQRHCYRCNSQYYR